MTWNNFLNIKWKNNTKQYYLKYRDFPGGPVVKNPPSKAGEAGSIPGQGTKIQNAAGQLSPRAPTTEAMRPGARTPHLEKRKPARHN